MGFRRNHSAAFCRIAGLAILAAATSPLAAQAPVTTRTPATPLVAHDPYFSIWSFEDLLAERPTRHWTGSEQQLSGFVRVDGKLLRFMGGGGGEAMVQRSRSITPTTTAYEMEGGGIRLTATFFTPALPNDLDLLSRPVTYLSWSVRSADGRPHAVQLYFDASAQLAVDSEQQRVTWGSARVGDMTVMRIGTSEQAVLQKVGDNLRIDWGWAQLAVPQQPGATTAMIGMGDRGAFMEGKQLPADDLAMPRLAHQNRPLMATRFDFGTVGAEAQTRRAMLAYDDIDAIEYFKRRLPAYWRRDGMTMAELLLKAEAEEASLRERGAAFDRELIGDLERAGGREYAELAVVAYRQTLAAHKLVADIDGRPLYFSKENFSNGCIATVDVTYPSSPFFLLLNPGLLEAQLRPILDYAKMPRWRFPFAPHDLGTYPQANGQVYGGGETSADDQMPVEESGNMLLMIAALAKVRGNADFAGEYWPLLSRWADFLLDKGLDPENQLSTDDFAGHLAHNANLSIKAISALDAYAELARMLGKSGEAGRYRTAARNMARQWLTMARDGDHTRLAFDKPGTWSQKYNLVWDKVLDRNLFPDALAQSEVRFYLTQQGPFGLPLDNRKTYTKLDWIVWSATLADSGADFRSLVAPVHRFMRESPTRVPLSDWYETTDGRQVGFQARSVVGGVYMKMLSDPALWRKWASRARGAGDAK
ncbi:glutaminase domain-containing protein [Sphingomonas sp. IW22]|uniref:glutaminase family protein n=1 Tax=Sphingomonas sp. IW22 TaxID=3242489 RepID=UPI003520DA45